MSWANRPGIWLPDLCRLDADGRLRGEPPASTIASFWVKGCAAAFQTWPSLVRNHLQALRTLEQTGEEQALCSTTNIDQGMPYLPRALARGRSSHALQARCEDLPRGVVPEGVRFLIAAVDVQGGKQRRFVVQVIGYGAGLQSWIVDRYNLRYLDEEQQIRLNMHTNVEHWEVLIEQVIERAYPLADGSGRLMRPRLVVCDSAGESGEDGEGGVTDRAYAFYRRLRKDGLQRGFMLVKGANTRNAPKLEERFPDTTKRR